MKFEGKLFRINTISLKSPGGARGHRVQFNEEASKSICKQLPECWVADGHISLGSGKKFGIVTESFIENEEVRFKGHSISDEINIAASDGKYGSSIEVSNAHMEDMRNPVWTCYKVEKVHGIAVILNPAFESEFTWN